MTGIVKHTIDAKGRIHIPSRLRDELGDNFHITISAEKARDPDAPEAKGMVKCLSAFSNESWTVFREKFNAMPRDDKNRMRPLFAHASPGVLDGQGRILLTPVLREWADLKRDVMVVGAGDCVQFWDSETWAGIDTIESTPENIADIYREMNF